MVWNSSAAMRDGATAFAGIRTCSSRCGRVAPRGRWGSALTALIRGVGLGEAKELRNMGRLAEGDLRAEAVLGSVGELIAADAGAPGDRPSLGVVGDSGRGQVVVVARDLAEKHGPARGLRCDHNIARLHVVRELVQGVGYLAELPPTVLWPGSCHAATDRLKGQPREIAAAPHPRSAAARCTKTGACTPPSPARTIHTMGSPRSRRSMAGMAPMSASQFRKGGQSRSVLGLHGPGMGRQEGRSRIGQDDDAGVRVID